MQDTEYRVDVVIEGAVERTHYFRYYSEALSHAYYQIATLANQHTPSWQVDIYDESSDPPEVTDTWDSEGYWQ